MEQEDRMRQELCALSAGRALKNIRRMSKRTYNKSPNWVLVMDLFGLGSTYSHALCRMHGIDPDGFK